MTTSIIAILAALVPLFVWLIRRHLNHEDDPYTQHTEKREQIAREIIRNDEASANRAGYETMANYTDTSGNDMLIETAPTVTFDASVC